MPDEHHLFIINPDLAAIRKNDFREESEKNPIYIKRHNFGGGIPLYLYSNTDQNYFSAIVEDEESDSDTGSDDEEGEFPSQYLKELDDLVRTNSIDRSRVSITMESSSATVNISDSRLNFYVNLQRNGEYFTIRRNPIPDDEAYIVHDISSWTEVIQRFLKWLVDIKRSSPDIVIIAKAESADRVVIGESTNAVIKRGIYSSIDISLVTVRKPILRWK